MHIHILGICGTFMAGLAILARETGLTVTGSDHNVYPPMSTQLAAAGIDVMEGFAPEHLKPQPDLVVVGNAMTRGNPAIEYLLDSNIFYTSGPQWLAEHVLRERWVLAVAGTHGKTTTSAMLAWILEWAGLKPGFLIGGIPANFGASARLSDTPFFVVEADEYDSAFFDKRSKFIHYHPRTTILNNLEFDHADIFPDLNAIKQQFHHFTRTLPSNGLIVSNATENALQDVLDLGCWTPLEYFSADSGIEADWQAADSNADGSQFSVFWRQQKQGDVTWSQLGQHNIANALAAVAAARHAGVPTHHALQALAEFQGVKRRMELRGIVRDISVYDDFAHHPSAVATTLASLRNKLDNESSNTQRIIAVLELRSNTMRRGWFNERLAQALQQADESIVCYDKERVYFKDNDAIAETSQICHSVEQVLETLLHQIQSGDQVLIMSNGGFANVHERLLQALADQSL